MPKKSIDLTRQTFGKLSVIERAENSLNKTRWKCLCDCGNYTTVFSQNLKNGRTKSCGCHQKEAIQMLGKASFIDLTGQTFGRLLVINRVTNSPNKHTKWNCLCTCNNYTAVGACELKSGNTKSCGCYRKERRQLPPGEAGLNTIYRRYIKRSEERGISFDLTKSYFKKLTQQSCYYCGRPPQQSWSVFPDFIYNGVDRLDNTKGYTRENCVPCCKECNFAKTDKTVEDFITWIKQVYNHLINIEKEN